MSCGLPLAAYETASRREPRVLPPLVNAALVHARLGENDQAEKLLQKAVSLEPSSAEAHFNLGLLKAEQGGGGAGRETSSCSLEKRS